MLRRIDVGTLTIGMFLHRVDGSWFEHGLWRTKFVIDSAFTLSRVRDSGISTCWIDTQKGLDVTRDSVPSPSNVLTVPTLPMAARTADVPAPLRAQSKQVDISEEMQRAAQICTEASKTVARTFADMEAGRAPHLGVLLPVVQQIVESVFRNHEALISLARIKSKDDYTYMHSVAVCALMTALARELGFDEASCFEAGLAGLLHDCGKTRLPRALLNKPGKLNDWEMKQMRRHPQFGQDLLLSGGGLSGAVLEVALQHHEKVDGTGYPSGLSGVEISLLSRMGAVCDVYDAVTSNRPYKSPWDPAEALGRMASWNGHFDKAVLASFIKTVGIYPVGSLVRLSSQRLAVVLEKRNGALSRPLVKVFYSAKSGTRLPEQVVDLSEPGCSDHIVGREFQEFQDGASLQKLWNSGA